MRVLLAGTLLGRGGIQTHLRWLAKALGEAGVPTLALSLSGVPDTREIEDLQAFLCSPVETAFCGHDSCAPSRTPSSQLRRFGEVKRVIEQFRPDVYVAMGTGWNLFLPVLCCRQRPRLVFHEVMS